VMNIKERNDKILDVILEEAAGRCAREMEEEDVFANLSEEDMRIMEENRDIIYKKTKAKIRRYEAGKQHVVRRVLILAAVIGVAVALALNVSAWRIFLFKTYTDMTGSLLNLRTTEVDGSRYDAVTEFAAKDEMIVPGWLPPGMQLTEIMDDTMRVVFYYEGVDCWVQLRQKTIMSKNMQTFVDTSQNVYAVKECNVLGMEGHLVESLDQKGSRTYKATWSSDNVYYELFTNANEQMAEAILSDLKFFR